MKYKINGSIKRNYGGGGGTSTVSSIPDWAQPYLQNVGNAAEAGYKSGDLGKVAGASRLQQDAFGGGANLIGATTTGAAGALSDQSGRLANLASTGVDTSGSEALISSATGSMADQAKRLTNMAMAPSAETLAAQKQGILLDAQKKVSGLNTGFGSAGTLGSARQAVMQGAQNAETTGQLAKVDAEYENNMFRNRLAAEQALAGTQTGTLNAATNLANLRSGDVSTRLAAEQALQGGATTGSNIVNQGVGNIAKLGGEQRGIDQQGLDAGWQGLQRYASTIYGNPARQQATGGK